MIWLLFIQGIDSAFHFCNSQTCKLLSGQLCLLFCRPVSVPEELVLSPAVMLLEAGFTSLKKEALAPASGDSSFFPSMSLTVEKTPSFRVWFVSSPIAEKKQSKSTRLWITMLQDSHCKFLDRSFVPSFNYMRLVPATLMLSSTSFSQQPLNNQYVCINTVCQAREPLLPPTGHSFLSALSKVMFRPVMKSWLHEDICEGHNCAVCSALENGLLFAWATKPIAKSNICS